MNRAYSMLEVKQVDDAKRVITGMATTPSVDRMGDIVDPMGATFADDLPLLHQHNSDEPVGRVKFGKPTKKGIPFTASFPLASEMEPGPLMDRVNTAWQEVKLGLVRAVSIGFRAIEWAFMDDGGIRFMEIEIMELSVVTIPANADATINSVKSIDGGVLAALGMTPTDKDRPIRPSVLGKKHATHNAKPVRLVQEKEMKKTIAEQITAFKTLRDQKSARMDEIMDEAAEKGETLDAAQKEEFDTLEGELKEVDEHIKRLEARQAKGAETAKDVNGNDVDPAKAALEARQPGPIIKVRNPQLAKGIGFARYVGAMAAAQGNRLEAAEFAKRWKDSTPEVEASLRMPVDVIRTAVAAGTTTDSTWAGPLVQYQNLATEFIEYLRPLTIIGRITGFRNVPFKVKVPRQTAAASVNWVGEAKVKPLTSLAFDSITLDITKIAGIIPLSEELVRFSTPSAELLVRDDLAAAITQFMDNEFIDPTNVATDVSPASVTYGAPAITATGTTAAALRADVKTMLASLLTSNLQITNGTWVMTQRQALAIALMQTSIGTPEFPGITMQGGTFLGFPVVTSENLPSTTGSPADGYPIIFILPGEILLADDGGVSIDLSREASLQMDTTPDSPFTSSTTLVSLWQHNMVAIKAERYINWKPRRSAVAAVINGANYAE